MAPTPVVQFMLRLAVTLILVVALSGCADSVEPAATSVSEPIVITDVGDVESLENQTMAQERHIHDYWNDQDRLVILDETKTDSTFFFSDSWSTSLAAPPGNVIPQGTSEVRVTVGWTRSQGDTFAPPELWVRTAANHAPQKVGPIGQGETVTIPTTLADADLPHQTLSAWRFDFVLRPDTPAGLIWFRGTVTMQVEAVRGLDIPIYPPHPDLWNGREEIPLVDVTTSIGLWQGDSDGNYNCFSACPDTHRPEDGVTVPYDSAMVEVTLAMDGPTATQVGLSYHAADSREWVRLQPDEVDGDRRTYRILVTPLMGDGPYAAQSQWEFRPFIEAPEEDGVTTSAYTLMARALRTP